MWGVLQNLWEKVKPIDFAALTCDGFHDLDQLPDEIQISVRDSYPSNHNFSIVGNQLVPSRKLATRVAQYRQYYPQTVHNLLDLSCSKGFFLFDAAKDANCERVLGIDLCDKTLDTCRQLRRHFEHPERIFIEKLTWTDLGDRIQEFGGPFETVLLVNTYQYLYFGSSIAPALSHDHYELFGHIRRLCNGRVIFHNRISFERVQKHIRNTPEALEWGRFYNPQAIRAAASEFFKVTEMPVWAGHPVWLLDAL